MNKSPIVSVISLCRATIVYLTVDCDFWCDIHFSFLFWFLIFKGGLYKGTQAPQGAAGSAYDAMYASEIKVLADNKDLQASKYLWAFLLPFFVIIIYCVYSYSWLGTEFDLTQLHVRKWADTVKPLLSGQPRQLASWPLNRGFLKLIKQSP